MKIYILYLMVFLIFVSAQYGSATAHLRNYGYSSIYDVALEPSGERYWVGTNDAIYQLDADSHQIKKKIHVPGQVKLLKISPDGKKIMTCGYFIYDSTPVFYELRNIEGGLIASATGDFYLSRPVFSMDSQKFIRIVPAEKKVQVFDCQTGKMVMETDSHDHHISDAAIHVAKNQREYLYVYSQYYENITQYRLMEYRLIYVWQIENRYRWGANGRISEKIPYSAYYGDGFFSINGNYFCQKSYCVDLSSATSGWNIYKMTSFNTFLNGSIGSYSTAVMDFSDDEKYFWTISDDYGRIVVRQLEEPQQQWVYEKDEGRYELIGDLCIIDDKSVMITIFTPYGKEGQGYFAIIDIETGQHISESPPITELFQDSNIQSWMLHE